MIRRGLALAAAAGLLAACAPGSSGGGGGPGAGLLLVTSGGEDLTDGSTDAVPTLDLRITAGGALDPASATVTLDGTAVPLSSRDGALVASVAAMPLGSHHHLAVRAAGTDESIGFAVVTATGAAAALHRDASGAAVLDLAFERSPDQAAVARAAGFPLRWPDPQDAEATVPAGAETLVLPSTIGAARGSHLAGTLSLPLGDIAAGTVRRSVVPAAPAPPYAPVVLGFTVGTAASHASLRDHVRLLSIVAPTGWQVGGGGALAGAPDAGSVTMAQEAGVPLWPVLQDTDSASVTALLDDGAAQAALVAEVGSACAAGGYAGVNLDFEGVPPDHAARLTGFATALAAALHAGGRRLAVDVVPHKPGHLNLYSAAYDIPALAAHADLVVLMAYDEHSGGTDPGPVAGLDWDAEVLHGSLAGIPPSHAILGLPLYDRTWSGSASGAADGYAPALASALAMPGASVGYDFEAQTPVVRWTEPDGTAAQLWFDDADSLARKIDLMAARGLGGIAMWRLGFEDPALWDLLHVRGR